jgi:5S rRNA maturation endonuclease (ribonuclease M5)
MSSPLAEDQDAVRLELGRLLREIDTLSRFIPVLVEGKRDVETLRRLGVGGQIVTLHRGKGLYEVAAELDRAEAVVLLLDWDARGEQQLKSLTRYLETDWESHLHIRRRFRELLGDTVVEVEHLDAVLAEPEDEVPS